MWKEEEMTEKIRPSEQFLARARELTHAELDRRERLGRDVSPELRAAVDANDFEFEIDGSRYESEREDRYKISVSGERIVSLRRSEFGGADSWIEDNEGPIEIGIGPNGLPMS